MARLTKLRIKDDNGDFPNTYPIGAEAENVILKDGSTAEESINSKAPIYHASETTEYGLSSENEYGHLKIVDEYEELNDDPSHTACSLAGIVDLFNRYLQIFQVLNNADEAGQMLYSAFNTAYRKYEDEVDLDFDDILKIKDDETLYLISKYFDIEDNDTSHQTLIVNIKDSY